MELVQKHKVTPGVIPLPDKLFKIDQEALGLHGYFKSHPGHAIFRNFLDSDHPLALDGQRHAAAALACLKIIFKHYHQVPLSHRNWFSQHYRHPRVDIKHLCHQRHTGRPAGSDWKKFLSCIIYNPRDAPLHSDKELNNSNLTWYLKTCISNQFSHGQVSLPGTTRFGVHFSVFAEHFKKENYDQRLRSNHVQFILQKSAYSHCILNFARRKVFRFGYLQRNHPIYLKKAIFALAKYIHRVTGRTAELRLCESLWAERGGLLENRFAVSQFYLVYSHISVCLHRSYDVIGLTSVVVPTKSFDMLKSFLQEFRANLKRQTNRAKSKFQAKETEHKF